MNNRFYDVDSYSNIYRATRNDLKKEFEFLEEVNENKDEEYIVNVIDNSEGGFTGVPILFLISASVTIGLIITMFLI